MVRGVDLSHVICPLADQSQQTVALWVAKPLVAVQTISDNAAHCVALLIVGAAKCAGRYNTVQAFHYSLQPVFLSQLIGSCRLVKELSVGCYRLGSIGLLTSHLAVLAYLNP